MRWNSKEDNKVKIRMNLQNSYFLAAQDTQTKERTGGIRRRGKKKRRHQHH